MAYAYRIIFLSFFVLSGLWVHASPHDSLRLEVQNGKRVVIHQVEEGETLYSLSRRYKSEVKEISSFNGLQGNAIALGQLLAIPVKAEKKKTVAPVTINSDPEEEADVLLVAEDAAILHLVQPKETLYSIAKAYAVEVQQLQDWNGLQGNELAIGQKLKIYGSSTKEDGQDLNNGEVMPLLDEQQFHDYYVQTGDMLETIARKFKVTPDSIVIWNELSNTYLAIGQRLKIRGEIDSALQMIEPKIRKTEYGKIRREKDSSGFTKVFEEGVAKSIEGGIETEKYLAMHRTLPVGKMVEIRNLMNNQKIFVRIVGILPETGINENTLIRLTPICMKKLGVIDPQVRVELSYYED